MRERSTTLIIFAAVLSACNSKPDPFKPLPECTGPAVTPFAGTRTTLVSRLAIADVGEGFDLDGDGKIDNKLSPLGALANSELVNSFQKLHDIVIPIEMFGYQGETASSCTKLAFYLGVVNKDRDSDGSNTKWSNGDCLDTDPNVHPGVTENLTNRLDDDCDGYADNATKGTKPTDTQDLDGDGYTLAMGDCDDRNDTPDHLALAKTRHPGAKDICDNGIDENCDGIPDNDPSCDPFAMNDVTIQLEPLSFTNPTSNPLTPVIAFKEGTIKSGVFSAGPDYFSLVVPVSSYPIQLELHGARLQIPLTDNTAAKQLATTDSLLGGVLEAVTLAQITHIDAGDVIKPDQSLLDAVWVGPVGLILGLDSDKNQHLLPDIDVDGDGLETFWQEIPSPAGQSVHVDTCQDGDGTIIHSMPGAPCALAKDSKGRYRFVDGLSVAIKFSTVPVVLSTTLAPK
jgi:hypothetical protein